MLARCSGHFEVFQERFISVRSSVPAVASGRHPARLARRLHIVSLGRGGRQKCPGGCRGGAPAQVRYSGRFRVLQERSSFERLSVPAYFFTFVAHSTGSGPKGVNAAAGARSSLFYAS